MFEHLYVLNGRKHSILRVDATDGTVETVTDQTGYLPDGIVTTPDRIYWTTMGKPTRVAVTAGTSPDDEWDFSSERIGAQLRPRRLRTDPAGSRRHHHHRQAAHR